MVERISAKGTMTPTYEELRDRVTALEAQIAALKKELEETAAYSLKCDELRWEAEKKLSLERAAFARKALWEAKTPIPSGNGDFQLGFMRAQEASVEAIEALAESDLSALDEHDRETRDQALEAAANTRPSRREMKPGGIGSWYECGWNDAIVAMDKAIHAKRGRPRAEKG